jgi:hypothetical protein
MKVILQEKYLQLIRLLNQEAVEYLVVDKYPIEFFTKLYDQHYMTIWLGISEENAKRAWKANKRWSGNPPTKKEFLLPTRRFLQTGVFFQTFYQNLDFQTCYAQRKIIEVEGMSVNFFDPAAVAD